MNRNGFRITFLCLFAAGFLFPLQACSKVPAPRKLRSEGSGQPEAVAGELEPAVKTAVKTEPPATDGTPGKYSKSFRALQTVYGLAAVPTYDGSNQSTHPKILYFPDGWNGYRYWMSITPYPHGVDKFENPCIVASNDMTTWVVPKGLRNPITGIPADVKIGGHYSDSHIVMNGDVMELWYRYNKGNAKTKHADYSRDYYYRITSTDGVDWSEPELMHSSPQNILSLVVNRVGGKYELWYTNVTNQLYHAVSPDGKTWEDTQMCRIPLAKGYYPWHQDLIFYGNRYYLLQTGKNLKKYGFKLFLSESTDGIHFTKGVLFYPSDSPTVENNSWLYRSSFFADENHDFQMMISVRLPGQQWYLMKCSMPAAQWQNACAAQKPVVLKGHWNAAAAKKLLPAVPSPAAPQKGKAKVRPLTPNGGSRPNVEPSASKKAKAV